MNGPDSQAEMERIAADERQVATGKERELRRFVGDGIGTIGGLDVAAGVCGSNAGDLRRSLDNDGRRLSVLHAMLIGTRVARFNPSLAIKIASAFAYPLGLEVFPRVTMTPEEENRRLKARLLAIGNSIGVGDQLVEEALKTP